MPVVINTNTAASTASFNLSSSNALLQKSLARLSSGSKIVNLNELEFSEGNWDKMSAQGYEVKDDDSSAVRGSGEAALRLIAESRGIPVHYCSSRFKDAVQLRKRLKRRAQRIALPSDVITTEGTLLKGVVEGPSDEIMALLRDEFEVPDELMRFDKEKKRVEVAPWVLEGIAPETQQRSAGRERQGGRASGRCRQCGASLSGAVAVQLGRCARCPSDADTGLLSRLRAWRSRQAEEQRQPAFVVLSDATLLAIVERRPASARELARVPGIGKAKLDRYGEAVLELFRMS